MPSPDRRLVGADQPHGAGRHRLGPLGGVAHDQHRLAERGRLLLHAAGVGEDQVRAVHQVDEGQVVERLDQVDVGDAAEQAPFTGSCTLGLRWTG